jgi:hypothetical protein
MKNEYINMVRKLNDDVQLNEGEVRDFISKVSGGKVNDTQNYVKDKKENGYTNFEKKINKIRDYVSKITDGKVLSTTEKWVKDVKYAYNKQSDNYIKQKDKAMAQKAADEKEKEIQATAEHKKFMDVAEKLSKKDENVDKILKTVEDVKNKLRAAKDQAYFADFNNEEFNKEVENWQKMYWDAKTQLLLLVANSK